MQPLAKSLDHLSHAACVVCGDTCAHAKPHPEPLLHAADLLGVAPECCLYVGDDERDIQSANAAGMPGIIALYGYLGIGRPPSEWSAHGQIQSPWELVRYL